MVARGAFWPSSRVRRRFDRASLQNSIARGLCFAADVPTVMIGNRIRGQVGHDLLGYSSWPALPRHARRLDATRMVTRNVSRLEKLGAPPWVRGLVIVVLALMPLGSLVFVTFTRAPQGGTYVYLKLMILWIVALIALALLRRLWGTTVSPRR